MKFVPKIKGRIHTDEKVTHVGKELVYDVNSIDSKTKFVVSHTFMQVRSLLKCREHFHKIKKTCGKQIKERYEKEKHKKKKTRKLITFVSDGFENYKNGATHYFHRTAKIVFGVPIACKKYKLKHNNNPIEKYNQDIKDQIVTKRHFGSFEGAEAFLDLRCIIKNYVNPHMSLKGKTPAQEAGIELNLKQDKLFELIKYTRLNHITKR
ncbi:MAG: hypothetical protein V1859_04785 [archaeon]